MAFSIGRLLGRIAETVVSAVPFIGAPIAEAIFDGRRQTFAQQQAAQIQAPLRLPVGFPAGSFAFGSQVGPTGQVAAGAVVPFIAGGAAALIRGILARASAFLGTRVNSARVLSLVRDLGLTAAAAVLGLTAIEVAQIIAAKPRRRRRGITAAQLSTTKATIRRVHSINDAIASVCPPARRRVHRHHPRHHRHS